MGSKRCIWYVKCEKDGFLCRITTVYGPVYDDKKDDFLLGLHDLCSLWRDVNLVRSHRDKKKIMVW